MDICGWNNENWLYFVIEYLVFCHGCVKFVFNDESFLTIISTKNDLNGDSMSILLS